VGEVGDVGVGDGIKAGGSSGSAITGFTPVFLKIGALD